MKKTISFAGHFVVKDKIKCFGTDIYPDYGAVAFIEFIDGSTIAEFFSSEDFPALYRAVNGEQNLPTEENKVVGFKTRSCQNKKFIENNSPDISDIKKRYTRLENSLMKKAKKRVRDILDEMEKE